MKDAAIGERHKVMKKSGTERGAAAAASCVSLMVLYDRQVLYTVPEKARDARFRMRLCTTFFKVRK